jgi:hypothetical protein
LPRTCLAPNRSPVEDLSGCRARQFSLGADLVLSDFAGSMGFDEATDWEYRRARRRREGSAKLCSRIRWILLDQGEAQASSGSVVRNFFEESL